MAQQEGTCDSRQQGQDDFRFTLLHWQFIHKNFLSRHFEVVNLAENFRC
jgi:hypothetical protein